MSHNTSPITHLDICFTRRLPPVFLSPRAHTVRLCLIELNIQLRAKPRIILCLCCETAESPIDLPVSVPLCLTLFSFLLPFTETLMDTKWATTELAWTAHPETGVSFTRNCPRICCARVYL